MNAPSSLIEAPPPEVRLARPAVVVAGLLLVGAGLAVLAGRAVEGGFALRPLPTLSLVVGLTLLAVGARARNGIWPRRTFLVVVVGGLVYLTMLPVDLLLYKLRPGGERERGIRSTKGRVVLDSEVSFKNAPGWHGFYRDGKRLLEIRTNSLGHRDEEPRPLRPGVRNLILAGDSFTFGVLLAQSETISSQIRQVSAGRLDAYNTGVSSYGPQHVLATFRRYQRLPATDWVYLFYNNDLTDVSQPWDQFSFYDGFIYPKVHEDGRPFTEAEFKQRLQRPIEDQRRRGLRRLVVDTLLLRGVRARLANHRLVRKLSASRPSRPGGELAPGVAATVNYTLSMKRLAEANGVRFWVVVLPALWEADVRRYQPNTDDYIRQLRRHGLDPIEPLGRLGYHDYISDDGHFTPSGARITAEAIVRALR